MSKQQPTRERLLASENASRKTRSYRSLLAHWAWRALRSPSRARVAPLPKAAANQVSLSFGGHSTVLLRYPGSTILCDPLLQDWCGSIRREQRAGLASAELDDVDLILLSSQDPAHLDPKTLKRLPRSATVVVPPRAGHLVSSLGFAQLIELSPEHSIVHRGIKIHCMPAQGKENGHKNTGQSYVVCGDGPSVFFCGSSGYFDGFATIGAQLQPDIALLPIGGYCPASFRKQNMSPLDALYAFEDLGAKIMIPIRHSAFALSYEKLEEPIDWLNELIEAGELENYIVPLQPGQSRVFQRPAPCD